MPKWTQNRYRNQKQKKAQFSKAMTALIKTSAFKQ